MGCDQQFRLGAGRGMRRFCHCTADSGQGAADADIGFPYLSVRGRLVIKDCIQMGAGFVLLVDSARTYLARIGHPYRAA